MADVEVIRLGISDLAKRAINESHKTSESRTIPVRSKVALLN